MVSETNEYVIRCIQFKFLIYFYIKNLLNITKKLKNKLSNILSIFFYHIVPPLKMSSKLPERVHHELKDFPGWDCKETGNILTLSDPTTNGLAYQFAFEYGYPYPEKAPLVRIFGNIPHRSYHYGDDGSFFWNRS